jgi:hypothetical protein
LVGFENIYAECIYNDIIARVVDSPEGNAFRASVTISSFPN